VVGLWLRDVPYIWRKYSNDVIEKEKLKGWRKYRRIYIIPTSHSAVSSLKKKHIDQDGQFVLKIKRKCGWDVIRYFMAEIVFPNDLYHIRVNGYPVNFPLAYTSGKTSNNVKDLYDYIGVKQPTIQDIEDWDSLKKCTVH
jgi:hypothetical protein